MAWTDAALLAAGAIGMVVAVIHGVLVQRLIVRPVADLASRAQAVSRSTRLLLPALIQFTTYNWFLSGAALVGAALWGGATAKLIVGWLAGSSFAYGAIANFRATRARHPGGWLYALAVVLILAGLL